MKETAEEAFHRWLFCDPNSGCWLWTAAVRPRYPYGLFRNPETKKLVIAHRFSYEASYGPIPAGLEIDHKCQVKSCVNPSHLRAVTHKQNIEAMPVENRGGRPAARNRTHCPSGHEFTPQNTRVFKTKHGGMARRCITCRNEHDKRYLEKKAARE